MSSLLQLIICIINSYLCLYYRCPGMVIPDLLPCGYLVGDNTNITITLNGGFSFCSLELYSAA